MRTWLFLTLNVVTHRDGILRRPTNYRRASLIRTRFDGVLGSDICCTSLDGDSFRLRGPRRNWAWNTRNSDVAWWVERHVPRWSGIRRSDTRRRDDFQHRMGGPWNSVLMAYLKGPAVRCGSLHLSRGSTMRNSPHSICKQQRSFWERELRWIFETSTNCQNKCFWT